MHHKTLNSIHFCLLLLFQLLFSYVIILMSPFFVLFLSIPRPFVAGFTLVFAIFVVDFHRATKRKWTVRRQRARTKKWQIITLISFRFRSEDQINDDLYISYTLHETEHCTLYTVHIRIFSRCRITTSIGAMNKWIKISDA